MVKQSEVQTSAREFSHGQKSRLLALTQVFDVNKIEAVEMGRQFSLAQWGQILYEVEFDFLFTFVSKKIAKESRSKKCFFRVSNRKNFQPKKQSTGISRFTLLMWGHTKKTAESKNRVNRGYLVVLKGRKIQIGQNYKPR